MDKFRGLTIGNLTYCTSHSFRVKELIFTNCDIYFLTRKGKKIKTDFFQKISITIKTNIF